MHTVVSDVIDTCTSQTTTHGSIVGTDIICTKCPCSARFTRLLVRPVSCLHSAFFFLLSLFLPLSRQVVCYPRPLTGSGESPPWSKEG